MSKRRRKKKPKMFPISQEITEKRITFADMIIQKAINQLWRWDTLEDVKL